MKKLSRIGTMLMAAVGLTAADANGAAAFRTREVVEFEQYRGNPAWAERAEARIGGATWQFHDNGTFTLSLPDWGLGAIRGRYSVQGGSITLEGQAGSSYGYTSQTSSYVFGRIDQIRGAFVVRLDMMTQSSMSAVVNGIPFGSTNQAAYRATAVLQRVR